MSRPVRVHVAAVAILLAVTACGGGSPAASGAPETDGASPAGSSAAQLPDALSFTAESDASASGTVTFADGGSVSAEGSDGTTFELVFPAEAVARDTEITITPLADVEGVTAEPGVVHAVQLEPEGEMFFKFLRLTIVPATEIPVEEQLMFDAAGDGSDPGPALVDPTSEEIVILLDHFTVEGVARVTPQQRAVFLRKSAENSRTRLGRELAARVGAERERQLLGTAEGAGPDISDLNEAFEREVIDTLRQAAELSCDGLVTYLRTVIGHERGLQLLGLSEADEAASLQRINDAVSAMQARYEECEQEAIAQCQADEDPDVLVEFWLRMERPPDRARAEEICEPKGLQFEFTGEGVGQDANFGSDFVTWHYWGLLCEGSEEWKIWLDVDSSAGQSTFTGPPGEDPYGPMIAVFGEDGVMTDSSWPGLGANDFLALSTRGPSGETLARTPPDAPTEVTLTMPAGEELLTDTAPVVPADGTIPGCEPAE